MPESKKYLKNDEIRKTPDPTLRSTPGLKLRQSEQQNK